MKIQHLAIIFVIIILPISMVNFLIVRVRMLVNAKSFWSKEILPEVVLSKEETA